RLPGLTGSLERLAPEEADALLAQARAMQPSLASADYVSDQARRLELPTRLARAELHVVKPHHRVLELPGSGGQLSHYLAQKYDLPFRDVFTVACADWRELALAGVVALECRSLGDARLLMDPELESCRGTRFDFVVGMRPGKVHRFDTRQLEAW